MKQQKKREKLRCLLLRRKRFFFDICDVITWGKKEADRFSFSP
jgi:hypothetical protein